MPTNNFGQVYNNGVKYIKINRFDSGGLDRTDYLQQLQSLRINYDDLGSIDYNIITTQEQNDYYVYGIQPKVQSTSSVNFETLDYTTSASKNTTQNCPENQYTTISNFNSITGNTLGYFDTTSGYYTFQNTPNVPINVTASLKTNPFGTGTFTDSGIIRLIRAINGSLSNIEILASEGYDPSTLNLVTNISASSNNFIETDILAIQISVPDVPGSTNSVRVEQASLLVTQSINPTSSLSSLTIFNPDFIDFEYNDYNALFGNAEQPQYSSKYMDIDYGANSLVPVNFNLIISGTADRAQVQDSNYESSTWTNIRYNGVRSNSPDFNQLTTDGGYGALPNVEQNKTYFAYFDGVGGTGPEIIGQTAYFIKWLIDENGNIVNPEPDTTALYNLIDSFESGKNALVRLTATDPLASSNPSDNALTGLHPITHVGRIATMLVTQTGSGQMDYLRTMSFNYTDGNPIAQAVANVEASWKYSGDFTTANSTNWTYFDFNTVVEPGTGVWGHPTSNNYDFSYPGGTLAANTRIKITLTFYLRLNDGDYAYNNTFLPRLLKNGNTDNPIPLDLLYPNTSNNNNYIYIGSTDGNYCTWETDWFDTNDNDTFQVQYQVGTGGDQFALEIVGTNGGADGTLIKFRQENPPTTGFINGNTGVTSSYWSVGTYLTGSNVSVLTASQALYSIYNNFTAIQSSPPESLAFNFSSCSIGFDPQPGDYIRFQYDKNRVHNITNVSTLSTSGSTQSASLFLTVVPPIATSSILDNFVLYRIVNDGTYVILDVEKLVGGNSFGGVIQPQYVSQTINNNYNNIIQDLTQKGLIT